MSNQDQSSLERRLQRLSEETGYQVRTRHGQRIYGGPPPGWNGALEPRGTEVYCYRLPRDCYEDELVPVFSSVGRLFELRMMVDFSGANRGYCYVRYCSVEEAEQAVQRLNNHQIRPGKRLAVTKSVDNQKLCFKILPNIGASTGEEELLAELKKILDGVVKVRILNKNWLEVEFETHRKAALARRKVVPGNLTIFQRLSIREVEWADPPTKDFPMRNMSRVIEARNLPYNTTEHRISRMFDLLSGSQVEKIDLNPRDNIAVVTFISHTAARAVLEAGNNLEVGGRRMKLFWGGWGEERRESEGRGSTVAQYCNTLLPPSCPGQVIQVPPRLYLNHPHHYLPPTYLPPLSYPHYFYPLGHIGCFTAPVFNYNNYH